MLYNKEHSDLYSSSNTVIIGRWAAHVAWM